MSGRKRQRIFPIKTAVPFGPFVSAYPSTEELGETTVRRSWSQESKRDPAREPKVVEANPSQRMVDFGDDSWLTGGYDVTSGNVCDGCWVAKPVNGGCC